MGQIESQSEIFKKSIEACHQALQVFNLIEFPQDYAEAQGTLWMAHASLAGFEYPWENLFLAASACREILSACKTEESRAPHQKDLASVCCMLAEVEISAEDKAQDYRKAVEACREGLGYYTAEVNPSEHSEIQEILWGAYMALAEMEDDDKARAESCKKALEACQRAIDIYYKDIKKNSASWAAAQKNLGYTYVNLSRIEEGATNRRKALEAYQRALEVYTLEKEPFHNAEIMRDLGYTYLAISEMEKTEENCKRAGKAFKKAFKAYSEAASKGNPFQQEAVLQEAKEKAERCYRAMGSCRRMYKSFKNARKD